MLEIGKRKYTQLRQLLLSSDIRFPAYQKVIDKRNNIVLRSSLLLYPNPTTPIGVSVSYSEFVLHTFKRIMATISPPSPKDFPLSFQKADGSGSHTIYNHHGTNTSTKSFILFCFKPVSIKTSTDIELWKNSTPNSPYCQRPVFLCPAKESESNIRQFMTELISLDTDKMTIEGFTLADNELVKIDIVRSLFEGKMAGFLSGAGGASCQLCTATHSELKDGEIVIQGFPINRHISDAIEMFGELEDSEKFFSLPSNERVNLTHYPVFTINITPASPLHSYTCIFRWFNLLVYHLEEFCKEPLSKLHTQLSAILIIFNSDRIVNTTELGNLC